MIAVCAISLGTLAAPATAAPTWLGHEPLAEAGRESTNQRVAVGGDGTAVAVWTRDAGDGIEAVQTRTRPAGAAAWGPVEELAERPGGADLAVAVAPDGTATVAWTAYGDEGDEQVLVRSRPAGTSTWGPIVPLTEPGSAYDPSLAVGADGTAIVSWTTWNGENDRVLARTRATGAAGWAPVEQLSDSDGNGYSSGVAVAGDGTTTAIWEADGRIQSRTRPGGTTNWGPIVELSAEDVDARDPELAASPDGQVTVVWESNDGEREGGQVRTRAAGASTWGPIVDLDDVDVDDPAVAAGADGTVAVAWEGEEEETGIEPTFVRTLAAGASTWSPVVRLSADGEETEDPVPAVAPDGTTTVVWENDGGEIDRVFARTLAAGASAWGPAALLSTQQDNADSPDLAAGGETVVAVWEGRGSDESDDRVHASLLDAVGPKLGDVAVPASGGVGQSIAFSVSPHDLWSDADDTTWDFGDGTTATGRSVSHVYAAPGVYTVTIRSRDQFGNETVERRTITIEGAAQPISAPIPPLALPAVCDAPFVVLTGIDARGSQVRLTGVASPKLAGKRFTVLRDDARVAEATVAADGAISATVKAPKGAKARAHSRYRISIGDVKSRAQKATRQAQVTAQKLEAGGARNVRGQVAGVRKPTTLTVIGQPVCGTGAVTTSRIRTDRRGRFQVVLAAPGAGAKGAPAMVYRVRDGKRTVTLTIAVTAR